ncbi:saccharopine dehydrogenase family protein [Asticcacaulis sp. AND118]|uniref:saccharopine dehydrogenase family protein n=1 Tax=Asticcacaulis sp. AND118 TaxID=2840468 RepID=UPI001CFFB2A3|nr:saccharopine dehydrogenase NADP-binding domain-containing protein [Asticcacaulis sp. AND118]UDF04198.1 saccharopine dehydrogenase NADP-binding domain-containing protein [Asticcacaulis sp. AND118]
MTDKVLILGGYGNFGKRIAAGLIRRAVPVIIAGRDATKAEACARSLGAEWSVFDLNSGLNDALRTLRPAVVVHTAGPYQNADYRVAEACIAAGIHYVDLSDARDFVVGFNRLDAAAKAAGVTAISGASTVPCLSSAVIAHFRDRFASLDGLDFGIGPGQGAERGLATTAAILSYVGKPLKPFAGHPNAYGWQGLRRHRFPHLRPRLMGDCDIPDLDLLPAAYGLRSIRFGAGLELGFIHLGLWALSWGVRWKLLPFPLPKLAKPLLKAADLFDPLGSDDGGMFMALSGTGLDGQTLTIDWHIIARNGDGPQIPSVPAILLAERLAKGSGPTPGARSSLGLIALADYLTALEPFDIVVS